MQTNSSSRFEDLGSSNLLHKILHHLDYKALISFSCVNRYLQKTVDPHLAALEDKHAFTMNAEKHFKKNFPTEDWPGNFACYTCCRVRGPEQFAIDQSVYVGDRSSSVQSLAPLTTLKRFCIDCGIKKELYRPGMFMSTKLGEELWVCECKNVLATHRCAACGQTRSAPERFHCVSQGPPDPRFTPHMNGQPRHTTYQPRIDASSRALAERISARPMTLLPAPEIATRYHTSPVSVGGRKLKRKLDAWMEPSKRRRTLDASATMCGIVRVKATIDNESRLYGWDGSKWHSGGERTIFRDSIPIGYVTEVEVDVPTLRRVSLTRDAQRNFFKAQVGESVLCAGKGEVESAMWNACKLNALWLPNGAKLVYESSGVDPRRPRRE